MEVCYCTIYIINVLGSLRRIYVCLTVPYKYILTFIIMTTVSYLDSRESVSHVKGLVAMEHVIMTMVSYLDCRESGSM